MIINLLLVFAAIFLVFNFAYILAVILKNNAVVDIFWGIGFAVAALAAWLAFSEGHILQLTVTFMVLIWSLRLSLRIAARNYGKPEDFRYAQWRQQWQPKWYFYLRSYLQIFILQSVLCFLVALPVIYINIWGVVGAYSPTQTTIAITGIVVWVIGFAFEAVGDWQLDRFVSRKSSKQQILDTGLWRYSRHPNYFGEATQWWGLWLIAISVSFSAWWTITSPALITVLLLYISGVPLLEKKMKKNPNYRQYMRRTNRFFPGPTKNIST